MNEIGAEFVNRNSTHYTNDTKILCKFVFIYFIFTNNHRADFSRVHDGPYKSCGKHFVVLFENVPF